MPSNSDQFEKYLRRFRPLPAEELSLEYTVEPRLRFRFWWAWTFCGAALIIAAVLLLNVRGRPVADRAITRALLSPLTLGRANAELFTAVSTEQSLDRLAFPLKPPLPKGQQSALDVLGREQTKL